MLQKKQPWCCWGCLQHCRWFTWPIHARKLSSKFSCLPCAILQQCCSLPPNLFKHLDSNLVIGNKGHLPQDFCSPKHQMADPLPPRKTARSCTSRRVESAPASNKVCTICAPDTSSFGSDLLPRGIPMDLKYT